MDGEKPPIPPVAFIDPVTGKPDPTTLSDPIIRLGSVITRAEADKARAEAQQAANLAAKDLTQARKQQSAAAQEAAGAGVAQAQQALDTLTTAHQEARGKALGLGGLLGEGARKQQLQQAEAQLAAAQTTLQSHTGDLNEVSKQIADLTGEIERLRLQAKHDEEVVNANETNLKGPFFEASPQMTEALQAQDERARQVKFYEDLKYKVEPQYMLPTKAISQIRERARDTKGFGRRQTNNETLADLNAQLAGSEAWIANERQRMDQVQPGWNESDHYGITDTRRRIDYIRKEVESAQRVAEAESNEATITATGFYETAIRYADEHHLSVNRDILIEGILKGMNNSAIRDKDRVTDKTGQKYKGYIIGKLGIADDAQAIDQINWRNTLSFDNYSAACFQLDELARKHGIPQDERMIPYVIAYFGGEVAVEHMNSIRDGEKVLMNLILDLSPAEGTTAVRQNGQWEEIPEREAPGFGSQLRIAKYNRRDVTTLYDKLIYDGTDDPQVAASYQAAIEQVTAIGQRIIETRCLRDAYKASKGNLGEVSSTRLYSLKFWNISPPRAV